MINIKKDMENFNAYYKNRIENNKEKLIDAFTMYYGEEHRDIINERLNNINFYWFVGNYDITCKLKADHKILKKHVEATSRILAHFGIKMPCNHIKSKGSGLGKDKNGLCVECGDIITTGNKKTDDILEALFGPSKIYKGNFKDIPLYNYFELPNPEKQKIISKLFKRPMTNFEINDCVLKAQKEAVLQSIKFDDNKYVEIYLINEYFYQNVCRNMKDLIFKAKDIRVLGSIKGKNISQALCDKIGRLVNESIIKDGVDNPFMSITKFHNVFVSLPVLFPSDHNVIHEVNHAIKTSLFAEDDGGIMKCGLYFMGKSNSNGKMLEEFITDKQTIDITKIFHRIGGNIFDEDILRRGIKISYGYEPFYPVVDKFYENFKDEIAYAGITDDFNYLLEFIDEDSFKTYKDYVELLYEQYQLTNKLPDDEQIKLVNSIIDTMSKKEQKQRKNVN